MLSGLQTTTPTPPPAHQRLPGTEVLGNNFWKHFSENIETIFISLIVVSYTLDFHLN